MTHAWRVIREPSLNGATMGSLYLNGVWLAWTLEDPIRAVKIPHETCIPAGRYRVTLSWSPKFQRRLPELHDVPNFTAIRMHSGNKPADTDGCLLVGFQRANAAIVGGTSRPAETALVTALDALPDGDVVWIAIENPAPPLTD